MPKLPFASAIGIVTAVRDVKGGVDERPIVICGQADVIDPLRDLLTAGATGTRAVQPLAVRRLQKSDRDALRRASLVVYGGTVVSGLDDGTREDLAVVASAGRPRLVILEALDLPSPAIAQAGLVRGISPDDILAYRRGTPHTDRAMRGIAERAGDAGPWLASRLPALRPLVVDAIVEEAARRCAKLALIIIVPGADMPALTAVQMRMVLRIAAAHGQEITPNRAIELLSVLGAGFGFRQLARSLLDFIPVLGWVTQAGVAYAGTRMLGRAAEEYFEKGAVADVSRLRAIAEGVRSELAARRAP